MSQVIRVAIFYLFLSVIFIFEGLGLPRGREISFYLILVMPFFLYFLEFILKKEIVIPKKLSVVYSLFILLSALATFISINQERSFPYLLFYISLFLIFLFVINNAESIKKYLIPFVFGFSFLFLSYSVFLKYLLQNNMFFLIPEHGYQFIFPRFGLHNHLGDFLVLPLVISGYFFLKKKRQILNILSIIFFLPFSLYSYSRSAYLSVIVSAVFILILDAKNIGKRSLVLIGAILILLVAVLLLTMREFPIQSGVIEKKDTFVARINFVYDGVRSVAEKPLGIGPSNYVFISGKYSQLHNNFTDSSHNIFLDIFVENGVIAGAFFLMFIFILIAQSDKKSALFFVFLAMLINMQTDYTHRIYGFLLLFFIIAGLVYEKNKEKPYIQKQNLKICFLLSGVIFLIVQYLFWT